LITITVLLKPHQRPHLPRQHRPRRHVLVRPDEPDLAKDLGRVEELDELLVDLT
jgi:hypothetical protein